MQGETFQLLELWAQGVEAVSWCFPLQPHPPHTLHLLHEIGIDGHRVKTASKSHLYLNGVSLRASDPNIARN